ncbi:serpin family protein [Patescibacteria group bacterium]|nr:serpin family protein [Patescibacteria group bacterium]
MYSSNGTFEQQLAILISQETAGNFCFSPLSIKWALTQLAFGARGETRSQMLDTLDFSMHAQDKELFQTIQAYKGLARGNSPWSLNAAAFAQEGHPILGEFKAIMQAIGGFGILDFAKNNRGATDALNEWARRATQNLIPKVLDYGMLEHDVKLVLAQAVRFADKWQYEFKDEGLRPFYVEGGNSVDAKFITVNAPLKSFYTDHFDVLAIPYADGQSHFVIMLPNDSAGNRAWAYYASEMHQALEVVNDGREELTALHMPEGSLSWGTHDLLDFLRTMGIRVATGPSADFSGIDGSRILFLSNVFHKCIVSWDKNGTTAGAVTVAVTRSKSAGPAVFDVDKSFYFMIVKNGEIGFTGYMHDPTAR